MNDLVDRLRTVGEDYDFHENALIFAAADEIKRLRSELVDLRNSMAFRTSLVGRTEVERDALRAKVAEMEKQEPVAKVESWTNGNYTRHYKLKWLRDVGEGAALYALPGAQGEEE